MHLVGTEDESGDAAKIAADGWDVALCADACCKGCCLCLAIDACAADGGKAVGQLLTGGGGKGFVEVHIKLKSERVKKTKKAAKKEVNLEELTVAELRDMAKDKEVKGYSTMKKAELVEALTK